MSRRACATSASRAVFFAALAAALLALAPLAMAQGKAQETSPDAQPSTIVTDIEAGGRMEPHKTAPGDCFARIAKKYGVPVADLIKANPGLDPEKLQVGQAVAIPAQRPAVACPPSMTEPPAVAGAGPTRQYQVAPGDTLGAIASRFGVRVEDILAVNEALDPKRLAVGQTLSIPAETGAGRAPVAVMKTLEQPSQAPLVTDFQ